MSRYSRRKLHPKCQLQIFICRLLGARFEEDSIGYRSYTFRSGREITVYPRWITESL
jgi:hypothetical protein